MRSKNLFRPLDDSRIAESARIELVWKLCSAESRCCSHTQTNISDYHHNGPFRMPIFLRTFRSQLPNVLLIVMWLILLGFRCLSTDLMAGFVVEQCVADDDAVKPPEIYKPLTTLIAVTKIMPPITCPIKEFSIPTFVFRSPMMIIMSSLRSLC